MPSRRELLLWMTSTAALSACSAQQPCPAVAAAPSAPLPPAPLPPGLLEQDLKLLRSSADPLPVVLRSPGARGVLRTQARQLSAADDIAMLQRRMRGSLDASKGVGIAAPQIGIGASAILVMHGARPAVPGGETHPHVEFYLNPRIVERSDEVTLDYEGCLSVADVCGLVRRNRMVVVEHGVAGSKPLRVEASGFDARIFQHEIDHLDGVLFVDRVEGGVQPKDKLKELREQLRRDHPELVTRATVHRREVLL